MERLDVCPILERELKRTADSDTAREICLTCPYPHCILPSNDSDLDWLSHFRVRDLQSILIQCKTCHDSIVIDRVNGRFERPHWKFLPMGGKIRHLKICGDCEIYKP